MMPNRSRFLCALFLVSACSSPPPAAPPPEEECLIEEPSPIPVTEDTQEGSPAVTLYNPSGSYGASSGLAGFGVFKERRRITLKEGENLLRITDIAATIDATSVKFRDLTDPEGTSVLEQSFEYDLVSADKLLEKYLGRTVGLRLSQGTVRGTLLSFDARSITLKTAHGVVIFPRQDTRLSLDELPRGLSAKPSLVWRILCHTPGEHTIEIAYEAAQVGWLVDYTLILDPQESTGDLSAWVSITNHAGLSLRDAKVKLVAGDVQRISTLTPRAGEADLLAAETRLDESEEQAGFSQKSFANYHLYTLGRTTDLPDRAVKQLELFEAARGVPVKKLFIAESDSPYARQSTSRPQPVKVYYELTNTPEAGLGKPLPMGKVRAYQRDKSDGSLEFLGEDRISHTPEGETLRLFLGKAFDIKTSRTLISQSYQANHETQSWEITVSNHKEEPVEVIVRESLYPYYEREIQKHSQEYEEEDAQHIRFLVSLAPGEEKTISYEVIYRYGY